MGNGADVVLFSRALNFLTMFIHTRDEHHVAFGQSLKACQGITSQSRIRAAEMRLVVDVVERSRKGVRHRRGENSAAPQRRQSLTTTSLHNDEPWVCFLKGDP